MGSTGALGAYLADMLADTYNVIGVARRQPPSLSRDFFEADISLEQDRERIVAETLARHKRIDAVINNAVMYNLRKIMDFDSEVFEKELRVNLVAPVDIVARTFKYFWANESRIENESKARCVINVSSVSAFHVYRNQATYAACKAALNTLTQHMADEFISCGIRANAIAPDSFPGKVSLEKIANEVISLLEGGQNGEIRIIK